MNKIWFFLLLSVSLIAFSCKNSTKTDTGNQEITAPETTMPIVLTEADIAKYTAKGKQIAQASFKTLAGNLKKAMKKGGAVEAIKFCNLKANPLVDSLSKAHHAKIKRTSNKLRSPANAASELETQQLASYMEDVKANKPLMPSVVLTSDNKVQFFAPIKTKAVCLKCHGVVDADNLPKPYKVIQELYPNDQATGYSEGELRGIWSIQFDR